MKLYTPVEIASSNWKIGYNDKILLLGSCFADNIGKKLREHYFQVDVNPYGILYNPASIAHSLESVCAESPEFTMVEWGGMWHSMDHHGSFSSVEKDVLLQRCEESRFNLKRYLEDASVVVVTLGTAWVYEYEGKVVANCHKIPANQFNRRRLTVNEIVGLWLPILQRMPEKRWIFTVSPIRHIKDGLHENQLSKSILLQAIEELRENVQNNDSLSYFPSYEIMLDELRDYRFYADDMLHPSEVAVDYIWQRLQDVYMSKTTCDEMRVLHQLWRDRHHKMLHPDSSEAIAFLARIEQRIKEFQIKYPWIN